ncbi:hypothetical protein [Corynebacterium antarcticum]|uniref:hypothetical protein n=1 Tax=Corynebacterium antarcticum TaxID=2800405 RepID=UPI0020034405|nr:hypothetical protein [Corynebacterium antarcticum]MCK7661964.1 hypothetical protein [Corynebacterium antarcticum]
MREIDWEAHARHRAQVIADEGQWIGLADEDLVPLWDFPPTIKLDAPEILNQPADMQLTCRVAGRLAARHPVAEELIADLSDFVETDGLLKPVSGRTRIVVVERAGGYRRGYKVTFTHGTGDIDGITTIDVHGIGVLDYLRAYPCPSRPESWKDTNIAPLDHGIVTSWTKTRDVGGILLAGEAPSPEYVGPAAEKIPRLIYDSLDAVYHATGHAAAKSWPIVVASPRPGPGHTVYMVPDDRSIWDVVAPYADAAGIALTARIWWPGDPKPDIIDPDKTMTAEAPTIVINATPAEEPTT